MTQITGDVLVSAGAIAYLGPFTVSAPTSPLLWLWLWLSSLCLSLCLSFFTGGWGWGIAYFAPSLLVLPPPTALAMAVAVVSMSVSGVLSFFLGEGRRGIAYFASSALVLPPHAAFTMAVAVVAVCLGCLSFFLLFFLLLFFFGGGGGLGIAYFASSPLVLPPHTALAIAVAVVAMSVLGVCPWGGRGALPTSAPSPLVLPTSHCFGYGCGSPLYVCLGRLSFFIFY